MKWQKKTKPEQGQYQILEVTRRDGKTTYDVECYSMGWDYLQWNYITTFHSYRKALAFIKEQRDEQVVSREVIWP